MDGGVVELADHRLCGVAAHHGEPAPQRRQRRGRRRHRLALPGDQRQRREIDEAVLVAFSGPVDVDLVDVEEVGAVEQQLTVGHIGTASSRPGTNQRSPDQR